MVLSLLTPVYILFLSTPSARRATRLPLNPQQLLQYFYPRPPRGGRHHHAGRQREEPLISIHALREEGDRNPHSTPHYLRRISIHALREEGDLKQKR